MTQNEWNEYFAKADREAVEALKKRIKAEREKEIPNLHLLARWETKLELLQG